MRILNFAKRNFKEIIRDPMSIIFSIILPVFLLYIFQQFKIPNNAFKLENFIAGIIVFSFSFVTLFTAVLVAKDRSTSLLVRLAVSPMKGRDYVIGYIVSVLPFVIIQNIIFFAVAILLGLEFNIGVIYTIICSLPISILFIGLGILIGSLTSSQSASGASSVIVQLVAFTSGMYFSTELVGKVFSKICSLLPFASCVNMLKATLHINFNNIGNSVINILIYTIIILFVAIVLFKKNMINDNK